MRSVVSVRCRPSCVHLRLQRSAAGLRCLAATGASSAKPSAKQQPKQQHVTIVGGGAAGLTAAFFAAREGAKVTVLERTSKCGTKILMSGGSRCNVLPAEVDLQRDFFTGGSASAMRAVFASWALDECRSWLENEEQGLGLALQMEQETLKWFPASNSSKDVRDRLVSACRDLGVEFRYNASVEGLWRAEGRSAQAEGQDEHSHGGGGGGGREDVALQQQQQQQQQRMRHQVSAAEGPAGSSSAGRGSNGAAAVRMATSASSPSSSSSDAHADADTGAEAGNWHCVLADGSRHVTDRVVFTTGGLSFPGVGTDGTGHRVVKRLGHDVRDTYPALTPLVGQHPGPAGTSLAGLSLYSVEAYCQVPGVKKMPKAQRTDLLFTHKGFSGPVALDLSHHAIKALQQQQQQQQQLTGRKSSGLAPSPKSQPAATGVPKGGKAGAAAAAVAPPAATAAASGVTDSPHLCVSWTGETAAVWDERLRGAGTALVATLLRRHGVRERLADALCEELGLVDRKLSQLRGPERVALVAALTRYPLPITGSEGYKKAEVTGGGVPLEQVNCATMESRLLPGLHLAGEILDVFGRIGGFNFYWAWVSGRLAGMGAALGGDDAAVGRALRQQKQLWTRWDEDW